MVLTTLRTGQQRRRCTDQTSGLCGRRGWDGREAAETQPTTCEPGSWGRRVSDAGHPGLVLRGNLEGWGGEGGGSGALDGGDTCLPTAGSC